MRENPAFESFVRERSGALLRTAYLLVGDRGHAEDLLQTALLRAARHWQAARTAPEAYVRQVLLNLCRDRWRRMLRRPRETALLPGALGVDMIDGLAERVGQRHVLVQALARLPAGQREVIVLRFVEDLPVAETAVLLGLSAGTVKSYTSRALATLRTVLDDDRHPGHEQYPMEVSRAH